VPTTWTVYGTGDRRLDAAAAAKEAKARRALGRQVIEDAERLVEALASPPGWTRRS